MPSIAAADDLAELRAQLEALTAKVEEMEAARAQETRRLAEIEAARAAESSRVAQLEAAQASEQARVSRVEAQIASAPSAVAGPAPTGFRNPRAVASKFRDIPSDEFQPGTGTAFAVGNTEIEIGGFAKLDFIFDTEESTGDLFFPPSISVVDDEDDEAFRALANESRLFFIADTPTSIGDIRVHLEADFFASTISSTEVVTNSFPFRLRHAYGRLDTGKHEFLAGQFWSALVPIETYPSTVDFGGPVGNSFLRQAQIRYTYKPTDSLKFVVSAENSETTLRDDALELGGAVGSASSPFGASVGVDAGLDQIPDFVLTATHTTDRSLVKGGLLLRELNAPDSDSSEFGYGIQVSGKYDFTDRFTFSGQAIYGEGIGRYIFTGINQGAFLTGGLSGGSIDAIETVSGFARFGYDLTDTWTLLATYGRYELLETFTEFDTDHFQSLHLTAFYQPIQDLQIGAEAILAERELVNGDNDDFLRFQTSAKWSF
ncbi:MAG: DcaP family trimeric outer membrane transporter [Pseudomonadota bacterium]